jgi:hypothetical protein
MQAIAIFASDYFASGRPLDLSPSDGTLRDTASQVTFRMSRAITRHGLII